MIWSYSSVPAWGTTRLVPLSSCHNPMDAQTLYRSKLVTIPEAVGKIKSHQTVGVAMAASEPPGLLAELGNHRDRLDDVHVWVCLPLGSYSFVLDPCMDGHFFIENWFYGAADRKVHAQGRESYIPNNLHQASTRKLYAGKNKVNVFIGTATPARQPRIHVALAGAGDGTPVDRCGGPRHPRDQREPALDAGRHPGAYLRGGLPGGKSLQRCRSCRWFHLPRRKRAIGGYIAELIEDGSTLQLGIGGIPNAITPFLMKRKDLGIHTEMFTDGMVDLYNAGVITNRRKTLWHGKMVGAFALGTQKLYDFVGNNLAVEFQQGRVTNDPYVIGRNYRMISINTALQVDMHGQVCSQSIGYRHFSGTGGQLDTHRGAQLSEGGTGHHRPALHAPTMTNSPPSCPS